MKQTTIRVSADERIKIIHASEKEGIPSLSRYIPFVLSEKLPVQKLDNHSKGDDAVRIALFIPDDIDKLIKKTIKNCSTRFRKHTLQDVVLTVILERVEELES